MHFSKYNFHNFVSLRLYGPQIVPFGAFELQCRDLAHLLYTYIFSQNIALYPHFEGKYNIPFSYILSFNADFWPIFWLLQTDLWSECILNPPKLGPYVICNFLRILHKICKFENLLFTSRAIFFKSLSMDFQAIKTLD